MTQEYRQEGTGADLSASEPKDSHQYPNPAAQRTEARRPSVAKRLYDLTPPQGVAVLPRWFHWEATICDTCHEQLGLYPCEDGDPTGPLENDTCEECQR